MKLYSEQHQHFTEQLRNMLGQAQQPLQMLKELADGQRPLWRTVRSEFVRSLSERARAIKPSSK